MGLLPAPDISRYIFLVFVAIINLTIFLSLASSPVDAQHVLHSSETLCGLLQRLQTIQQAFHLDPQFSFQSQVIELILYPSDGDFQSSITPQVRSSSQWLQAQLSDPFLPTCEPNFERQLDNTASIWRCIGWRHHCRNEHDLQPRNT